MKTNKAEVRMQKLQASLHARQSGPQFATDIAKATSQVIAALLRDGHAVSSIEAREFAGGLNGSTGNWCVLGHGWTADNNEALYRSICGTDVVTSIEVR